MTGRCANVNLDGLVFCERLGRAREGAARAGGAMPNSREGPHDTPRGAGCARLLGPQPSAREGGMTGANTSDPVLGSWQSRFLLRLGARIVPEIADAPADVRYRVVATINEALALQAPAQRRMFKLLLFALQWMTLPFTLRRLEQLPPRWQD